MTTIHELEIRNLLRMAKEAQSRAYAPYSRFQEGAVVKGSSGAYYLGCNIENASYSITVCAERVALAKAVYDGERAFDAVAIVSDSSQPTVPCGACRQFLSEFLGPDVPVICADKAGEYIVVTLAELYPYPFLPKQVMS